MNDLYVQVVLTVGGLVLTAVSAYATRWIRAHVRSTDFALAVSVAQAAVKAVEQMSDAHGWNPMAKYQKALELAKHGADVAGIHLTDAQWQMMIERGVQELKSDFSSLLKIPDPQVEVKAP